MSNMITLFIDVRSIGPCHWKDGIKHATYLPSGVSGPRHEVHWAIFCVVGVTASLQCFNTVCWVSRLCYLVQCEITPEKLA